MTRLRPLRAMLIIGAIAVGMAMMASLAPDNEYQRWQLLDGTIHARARWIYERTHFDPTPIDVAIVGPSRTGQGVDAPRLARDLAARGVPANVVNFSLPESGRNINWLVVDQLLREKSPRLIIVGVTEKPSRLGHSAFKFLAPARDILAPGYPTDLNYFSDLLYLPYRQLELFTANLFPGFMGLTKTFQMTRYGGQSLNTTGSIVLPDGSIKEGERPASTRELARGVRKLEQGSHAPLLPAAYADAEFGDERHYIREIASVAHAHGARVAFLFLPYYSGPSGLQEQHFYEQIGPVWNAGFLSTHAEWFADYGHLTRTGAQGLTDWLADQVTDTLRKRTTG